MKIGSNQIRNLIQHVRKEKSLQLEESNVSTYADIDVSYEGDDYCEVVCASLEGVVISNTFLSVSLARRISAGLLQMSERFVHLRGRRCAPFGGRVTEQGLIPKSDIPRWLQGVMDRVYETILQQRGFPKPNHALVNLYEPGDGIMAHEDGPAYTPYAAILSLGSACVFDFVSKSLPRECVAQAFLPVGSLMVFSSQAYTNALHEVRFSKFDAIDESVFNYHAITEFPDRFGDSTINGDVLSRGRRISITMRHVPNYVS